MNDEIPEKRPLIAVITTTIHVPVVLSKYVAPEGTDMVIIVAGDKNTPDVAATYIRSLDQVHVEGEGNGEITRRSIYMGVNDEITTRWKSNEMIGFRSIQRRNLALLHAISLGADYVITVDDDNEPRALSPFINTFYERFQRPSYELLYTDTAWFDPGRLLLPETVARGYPIPERENRADARLRHLGGRGAKIGVVAGLTIGDPDVDAIERIVNAPHVSNIVGSRTFDLGTWAPFNTQNTAYLGQLAPIMQCLVGVGRYDDIIMSYVARRIMDDMGLYVYYGHPVVYQARNEHNLIQDMRDEMFGYDALPEILEELRSIETHGPIVERLAQAYDAIREIVLPRTRHANDVWLDDVTVALKEGEQ